MGFEEAYVPEDEQEMELMEDIHLATRRAYRRGLSKVAVGRIMAFMAAGALAPDQFEEPLEPAAEAEEEDTEPEPNKVRTCPECDQPIARWVTQMGGVVELTCGHEMDWEEFKEEFPGLAEEV